MDSIAVIIITIFIIAFGAVGINLLKPKVPLKTLIGILVPVLSVAVGFYLFTISGTRNGTKKAGPQGIIAVDEQSAVFVKRPFNNTVQLVKIRLDKGEAVPEWRRDIPRWFNVYVPDARIQGNTLVMPVYKKNESSRTRLLTIDLEDGSITGMPEYYNYWLLLENRQLLVAEDGHIALYTPGKSEISRTWRVSVPAFKKGVVVLMGATAGKIAAVQNKSVYVIDRKSGKTNLLNINSRIIGLSRKTGELLMFNNCRLVARSLVSGKTTAVNLASVCTPYSEKNRVRFYGRAEDNWLFLIPADLPQLIKGSEKRRNFLVPARYIMAAVNMKTRKLSWKMDLGPWEWDFVYNSLRHPACLDFDRKLNAKQLFHVVRDVKEAGGSTEGLLVYIDLVKGAVIRRNHYTGALKSNMLADQVGDAFYLKINHPTEMSRSVLARFSKGTLDKAVWLPDYDVIQLNEVHPKAVWSVAIQHNWYSIDVSTMKCAASGEPGFKLPEATLWTKKYLGLTL